MLNLKHLASHAYRQYELVTCINMLWMICEMPLTTENAGH